METQQASKPPGKTKAHKALFYVEIELMLLGESIICRKLTALAGNFGHIVDRRNE